MRTGRPKTELELDSEERAQLEAMVRSRSLPAGLVRRAKIVLHAADGESNTAIAKRLKLGAATVGKWRARFAAQRIAGLESLVQLGPLPSENEASPEHIRKFEQCYRAINRPVTDDEARALLALFGNDGCFGLASSLVHLIETAPSWPLKDCLTNTDNVWVRELRNRAIRGRLIS